VVHVALDGQSKKMTVTTYGQWTSVSWPFRAFNTDKCATYQLILEFNGPRFSEGERQVLTHLSKLLDTQSMSDVTFVVENEKIDAHAIVVSGSPVICTMLEKDKFKEGHTRTVEIEDIEPSVFKEMLRYLYTGNAPKLDQNEMIEPLFLAADKYQIEALKNCCEQRLIKTLNLETVVHYLVLAHLYTAPQLLEASLKFLEKHKKQVWTHAEWKELNKSYPDLFFLASHRMVEKKRNKLQRLLSFIR
jgi:speckle-type POZ protein